MGDLITFSISIWDSGCLPQLLAREMADVQRRLRVLRNQLSGEEIGTTEAYLGQLEACHVAVITARGRCNG